MAAVGTCGTVEAVSIYLDHAATTPIEPRVLDAMRPFLEQAHGNPSSLHAAGRDAPAPGLSAADHEVHVDERR
jgi:cysteine sulfinate desulfinase/cysteine desulfurase-like protein